MQDTPQWGIEPVPERLRVLGLMDTTLLWTNLGISLLVLVLPAYFDLPLRDALAATLVGAVIGNLMLAVAALIGADARVPTMVLQRAPLGRRGSYLPTALNILQCLGWAIFELIVIATAAGLLCDKLFGFKAVWVWKLVFGVVAAVLALLGPVGFVRRFVRKFAIWAVARIRRLPRLVDRRRRKPRPDLDRRRAQGVVLARGRHRRRRHRVVGAARRRLHALLAGPAQRVLRRRHRLLPADALPVRVRLDPRAVTRRRPEAGRS